MTELDALSEGLVEDVEETDVSELDTLSEGLEKTDVSEPDTEPDVEPDSEPDAFVALSEGISFLRSSESTNLDEGRETRFDFLESIGEGERRKLAALSGACLDL